MIFSTFGGNGMYKADQQIKKKNEKKTKNNTE